MARAACSQRTKLFRLSGNKDWLDQLHPPTCDESRDKKAAPLPGRSMRSLSKAMFRVYGRYLVCRHTLDAWTTPGRRFGFSELLARCPIFPW
jgi:hypothetical protein